MVQFWGNCTILPHRAITPSREKLQTNGYYRPIRNWNDGKVSEYKSRKTYRNRQMLPKADCTVSAETAPSPADVPVQNVSSNEIVLLSTKSCPNCRIASSELMKAGIPFRTLYAEDPEGEKIARTLGINNAPTLIVSDRDTVHLVGNVSNIRSFIQTR